MAHNKNRPRSKRTLARDDARSFERFMAAHNEEQARRDAEESRSEQSSAEEFADRFTKCFFYGRMAMREEETC